MNKKISGKTEEIFKFIKNKVKENSYPPTLREIAMGVGLNSTWTVRYHLKKLSDYGYIKLKKGISRGIEIFNLNTGIPLLGRISAGIPEEAIENAGNYISDLADFFGANEIFALKVKGNSMEGEGIKDNDIVIVKKQQVANDGDIVAAMIDGEVTVKFFYHTKQGIKLVPANPAYKPIISKNVEILGKVTGVIRKY